LIETFNFDVHIVGWLCGAKLKRGWGISFNKFLNPKMINESLFKLGMGVKGVATM
jgi:hypothetical protein